MTPPAGYEADLSAYRAIFTDPGCDEPIAWGFKLTRHLTPDRFEALRAFGSLECMSIGNWALVTKRLTVEEAVQKYGPVTELKLGPQGGVRSITYGTRRFLSREAPRTTDVPPRVVVRVAARKVAAPLPTSEELRAARQRVRKMEAQLRAAGRKV